jgi:DNA mismatch repair protein MutL
MGRIHLLGDDVINKIAAGEVVDRPASVVKELVENALDAGAANVEVSLELGGARSIAVTDDGSGMDPEDAALALRRHATSKIAAADDLFNIKTMGFRGEALAAIASVSRFSLATTRRGAETGIKLTVQGGEAPASWPWNGPAGTTVVVENLFYNVPVRAKFLKAPATELGHCLELMHAFALCHPGVAFTLRHNGREQFRAPALAAVSSPEIGEEALRERAKAVLGKDAAALVYVRTSGRHGDLEALASPPGVEKASGKHLHTFVNGRWVKDKVLRYGILRGYHSHLLKGRFPVAVVHLRLDPSLVDVNVHPAKTEVRFQYPDEVQSLVALALRQVIREAQWVKPAAVPDFGAGTAPLPGAAAANLGAFSAPSGAQRSGTGPARLAGFTPSRRSFGGMRAGAPDAAAFVADKSSLDALLAAPAAEASGRAAALPAGELPLIAPEPEPPVPWDDLAYLGAFDRCYLLFAAEGRLLAVDQHAFHERVLYERLVRDRQLLTRSQQLLVPEALELSPSEVASLRARWPQLAARGFDYQAEGDTTVLVKAVPALLAGRDLADLFADLGRDLAGDDESGSEPADTNSELARLILAKAACHAAVRAGEELPENELKQLLAEAATVDFFHNCPHGRRVFKWWTRGQVARWFDR